MKQIGIIGQGRFGSLLKKIFEDKFDDIEVITHEKNEGKDSLIRVCEADLIIPAVPISDFEGVIRSISNYVNSDSTVMDVCSVKTFPVKIMKKYLPDEVKIIATHPMFGPDSTKDGTEFEGLRFIYNIIRGDKIFLFDKILELWQALGIDNIEMTSDEHDRQAAYTHLFAFLVGKVGIDMEVRKNQISTKGFENGLLYNQKSVENDSHQLFLDMNKYNPYAREMRSKFQESLEKIESELNSLEEI